jgi:hypothetical protein
MHDIFVDGSGMI